MRPAVEGRLGRMEVADALRALGGTARWKALRGHVSWRAIKRARTAGTVEFRGGTYHLLGTDEHRVTALRHRAVRSHKTAAQHHGFALPPQERQQVHLTVPANAHRDGAPADVRFHYRDLGDHEKEGDVTTPLRTVLDCLRDESLRVALSVGDSALAGGAVTRTELAGAVGALRGPGSAVARTRLTLLDAGAANAFESCARAILIAAGIVGFETQVTIRHRGQWVGRVDLANRLLRIVVECDGFESHGGRDAFVRDLVRFTRLVAGGWRPLRFTWEQVMFRPEWVLEMVRGTIDEHGALSEEQRPADADRRAA